MPGKIKKILSSRVRKLEKDLQEVIEICVKIANEQNGSATCFFPNDEDKPLYDELVKRKVMMIEPLEKGYMFAEEYVAIYSRKDPNTGQIGLINDSMIQSVPLSAEDKAHGGS